MKININLFKGYCNNSFLYSIICAIGFVILILFFYKADLRDMIVDHVSHVINVDEEQFIYNFTDEMQLTQRFSSPAAFDYITLSMSNHDKVIAGKTMIEIWEENDEDALIYQEVVNSDIHVAGPFKIFFTDVGGGKAGQIYEVRISAADTESQAMGFFGYLTEEKGESAILNGERVEYSLSIGCHSQSDRFMALTWGIFVVGFALLAVILFLIHYKKIKEEYFFLAIAVPVGFALFLFLSINPVNDGGFHYISTYRYSNALLGIRDEEVAHTFMRFDDAELAGGIAEVAKTTPRNKQIYVYSQVFDEFSLMVKNDILVRSAQHQITMDDTVWSKLPAVLGLTLGRLLHLGFYPCLYLARLFSFLFFIMAGFYAIRKTPVAKMGFVFALTLPSVARAATGMTYDSMVTVLAFIIAALIFKMRKNRLDRKEMTILWIAALAIGGCKGGIYVPILLLTFLVFMSTQYSRKEKWVIPLVTCGLGGVSALLNHWHSIIRRVFPSAVASEIMPKTSENYGISYAITNPLTFLGMQIRSLAEYFDIYIGSLFGNGALWISGNGLIPWAVILVFTTLLVLSVTQMKEDYYKIDYRMRIGCGIVVLGVIVGINLFFMGETPVGDIRLWGVQGRYFLPLIPFLLIMLRNNGLYYEQGHEKRLYLYWAMAEILFLYYYMRNVFFEYI